MAKKLTIKIRPGIFETNSSSTHSISIGGSLPHFDTTHLTAIEEVMVKRFQGSGYVLDRSLSPDLYGVLRLEPQTVEFGWEIKEYNDASTKAAYCLLDAEGDKARLNMLDEVLREQTGAKLVDYSEIKNDSSEHAFIDHQSVGTTNKVFQDKATLRNFIFNKLSVLKTDNDNH